jgi:heme-degrading monooxygenase HmoA
VYLGHMRHHLAQVNIARLVAPLDSEQLRGFVEALDPINALADGAPGFVWRLQTEDGDATALRPYDDDMLIVNMSVWESLESLADFVYRSDHQQVMRGRRLWFERMSEAYMVLWWVPEGHRPSVDEAKARLELLRANGPSSDAFTFRSPFPPPGTDTAVAPELEGCAAD